MSSVMFEVDLYFEVSNFTCQKKAREMWFLSRMYNAQQALDMGLINTSFDRSHSMESKSWVTYKAMVGARRGSSREVKTFLCAGEIYTRV
eukprot:1136864-Pelagomonas_calceolata.AAC.14